MDKQAISDAMTALDRMRAELANADAIGQQQAIEAVAANLALVADQLRGATVHKAEGNVPTVQEVYDLYRAQRLLGCSRGTEEQYEVQVRLFGPDQPVTDLTNVAVCAALADRLREGRSPYTANKMLRHLRALANFAHELGILEKPLTCRALPVRRSSPRAWTVEEIGRLLRAASNRTGDIEGIPARVWWPALVLALYDTGVRIRALMSVRRACVQMESRKLIVEAAHQKDREDQIVKFSVQTQAALERLCSYGTHEKLFPWPWDKDRRRRLGTLNKHFRQIVLDADLDTENGLFHRIRRTRATYGEIAAPGSATADLGHSVRWLTERHYLDPLLMPESSVVDDLPRPQAYPTSVS